MTLVEALAECPVAAILRGVTPEEIESIAGALYAAGIRVVEVPLNSPRPLDSLRRLTDVFGDRMVCGSGTVLTLEDVEGVAAAGGRLADSPNTQADIIARALELGVEPVPGFATATEAFTALAAGARHLKLFPASTYGPDHLAQLGAVLPAGVTVWAVGGVGAESVSAWRKAAAGAFGIGSDLYRPGRSPTEVRARTEAILQGIRIA